MKLFDVYPLNPICLEKGKDAWLWDNNGTKYLDFYGGHAVISVGHSNEHYIHKITEQLSKIGYYSNSIINPLQTELAENLAKQSGYPNHNLFLCNSGAEANENAFKVASFHTGKKKFIVMKNSFHGRTSAAVAATDDTSIVAPVNETDNFIFTELNNLENIKNIFKEEYSDNTSKSGFAGVVVEGIQGVGGIYTPTTEFLQTIRELCNQHNCLLIADEVQSGYGRTGMFFAHSHSGVEADIITIAKGMGNGFPVAGVLISPKIKAKHKMLGTTFGGNYLACAAANAVLELFISNNYVNEAKQKGEYLINELKKIPMIKEVRGMGLMIGIDFEIDAKIIAKQLLNEHKIFTGSATNPLTMRLLPPLCISYEQIDLFLNALQIVCANLEAQHSEAVLN